MSRKQDLGLRKVPGFKPSAGLAYVFLPKGVEREAFVNYCYSTNTVSFTTFENEIFHHVPVDADIMKRLEFPEKAGEFQLGTLVVFLTLHKENYPVVVGTLRQNQKEVDISVLRENYWEIVKSKGESSVCISLDGEEGDMSFSSDNPEGGFMEFRVSGAEGAWKVSSTHLAHLFAKKKVLLETQKEFEILVRNKDDDEKTTSIKYQKGVGFTMKDEFENVITIKDGEISIETKNYQLKADEILFGSGKESLVLGETLKGELEKLISAIEKLTVPTGVGPSGTPINIAEFTAIKAKLSSILSKKTKTD
jgi:hypothetical protein